MAGMNLFHSPSLATALLPYIGYHQAARLAFEMKSCHISLTEANRRLNLLPEDELQRIIGPDQLLKEGFTLSDILENNGKRKGE
jgi:aspartate ammonia-lyase